MQDEARRRAAVQLEEIASILTQERGAGVVRAAALLVAEDDFGDVRFALRNLIAIVIGFARNAELDKEREAGIMMAHAVLVELIEE